MRLTFGKYRDVLLQRVILKNPEYVQWMLKQQDGFGSLAAARSQAVHLIRVFDAKDFLQECDGRGCDRGAVRCTFYRHNYRLSYWWCDECDPYQTGAVRGKLREVRTYHGVLAYVDAECDGRRADKRAVMKILAEAKGLPGRVTDKAAIAFFE